MIKSNNRKRNRRLLLLVLLLSITVGYALLSTTLKINGTASIKANTWDIHFDHINEVSGSVDADVYPHITDEGNIAYEVTLSQPGDFYEFEVDAVNGGTVNAKLSELPTLSGVSATQTAYVDYTFTHKDGTPIEVGEKLTKNNDSKTFVVHVGFKSGDEIDEEDLPTEDQTLRLSVSINYQQDK